MNRVDEFWAAVGAGDEEKVREMVGADPSLTSARNTQGLSAVLAAAYGGHPQVAKVLAEQGADLSVFEAAVVGDSARVEKLLDVDPSLVTVASPDGFTPLHLSAFFGQAEVMKLLLDHGARVDVTAQNAMGVRPIHSAAAFRDGECGLKMVSMLVDHGAEVNVVQAGGWTPLHQAAAHGETRLVEYLLQHGADPTARSDDGRLPVDMACSGGYDRAAELLVEATASRSEPAVRES